MINHPFPMPFHSYFVIERFNNGKRVEEDGANNEAQAMKILERMRHSVAMGEGDSVRLSFVLEYT